MLLINAIVRKGLEMRANAIERRKAVPAIEQQTLTLRLLLQQAAHTAFGTHYDFYHLLTQPQLIRAFQQAVPIHDYNTLFSSWWHRCLQLEPDICWDGTITKFALSSGTSGSPSKFIPVSKDMTTAMQKVAARNFFSLTKYKDLPMDSYLTKDILFVGSSSDLKNMGGYHIGDLSGINAKNPPIWLRPRYKPSKEVVKIKDWNKRIERIAQDAPQWDIGAMSGIPSWVQLTLEKVIEYNKLNTIHDLWPNLHLFVHGGIAFAPYKLGFEKLLARPLTYVDTYLASEGFFAYQSRPDANGMELVLDNAIFFEFVPFTSDNFTPDNEIKPTATAYTIDQVQEGVEYAFLISTNAGAWRYLVGDTIKFTDLKHNEIAITGRTKHFLSICGEHLSVDNMTQAIKTVEQHFNVALPEFTVCAIPEGSFFAHRWYVGAAHPQTLNAQAIAQHLDEALQALNDDYRTERASMLKPIQLDIIPTPVFYNWLRFTGKSSGQSKVSRVMKPDMFQQWEQFVRSQVGEA